MAPPLKGDIFHDINEYNNNDTRSQLLFSEDFSPTIPYLQKFDYLSYFTQFKTRQSQVVRVFSPRKGKIQIHTCATRGSGSLGGLSIAERISKAVSDCLLTLLVPRCICIDDLTGARDSVINSSITSYLKLQKEKLECHAKQHSVCTLGIEYLRKENPMDAQPSLDQLGKN